MNDDVVYRIDATDRLCWSNAAFDHFAALNEGPAGQQVQGCSLFDFISDATTRELYRSLLARTRAGRWLRFAFRCDSAATRRFLEMEMQCLGKGEVQFRVSTRSKEERPHQALLEVSGNRSQSVLTMCSWCKRTETDAEWVEIEEALLRLKLFEKVALPEITHGICPDCFAKMEALIGLEKKPG